jgi:hypothetical protein
MKMNSPEFQTDEEILCINDIRNTTSKLIRAFSIRENELKLKIHETKSPEFETFKESFENLQKLYSFKLGTPMEEVLSIKSNLKRL